MFARPKQTARLLVAEDGQTWTFMQSSTASIFSARSVPREDAQGYVSMRCNSRAKTYPCASSHGNASRGKDQPLVDNSKAGDGSREG